MDDIIRICDGASVIIDDLNNHINRIRKLVEGQKPPANSAVVPCNFRWCQGCEAENCTIRGSVMGCVPNCTAQ